MKTVILVLVTLFASASANACFLKGERISGMNKICYYDCVDGERAITIGATELCPLSLYRDLNEQRLDEESSLTAISKPVTLEMSPIIELNAECLTENGFESRPG